jgi:translation initiation factor IF-2
MNPTGETCKTECKKEDKKAEDKEMKTVEVARKHQTPMAQFEAEATKLASTLAHAFKNGDAKAFVAALPEDMRKDFDEKKFMEAHKMMTDAMGEIVSADFLTDLKHPLLSIRLWKIGFKKISKDVGEITQQAVFQVSIGEVDKKAQVVSFGFI